MEPIEVINKFLATGYENVDLRDVNKAIDDLSQSIPNGDIGEYCSKRLDELRHSAETIWMFRSDKYWERFLLNGDKNGKTD